MAKKFALAVAVVLLLAAAAFAALVRHRSESVEFAEVALSAPYLRAIRSLSRKENLEAVVSSGGAVLVSRDWEKFDIDLQKIPRISSWEMRGLARMVVRGASEEFHGEATIVQTVRLDRFGILVRGSMEGRAGFVVEHDTELKVSNSRRPMLSVRSRIVYERVVPFWMRREVDERVSEYNKSHLRSMLGAIKRSVEQ